MPSTLKPGWRQRCCRPRVAGVVAYARRSASAGRRVWALWSSASRAEFLSRIETAGTRVAVGWDGRAQQACRRGSVSFRGRTMIINLGRQLPPPLAATRGLAGRPYHPPIWPCSARGLDGARLHDSRWALPAISPLSFRLHRRTVCFCATGRPRWLTTSGLGVTQRAARWSIGPSPLSRSRRSPVLLSRTQYSSTANRARCPGCPAPGWRVGRRRLGYEGLKKASTPSSLTMLRSKSSVIMSCFSAGGRISIIAEPLHHRCRRFLISLSEA